MPLELYMAYVLACAVITLIPGPTVTVIIANSLAHGPRAGLLNVAGTQLGLGLMMAILVVGLSSVIAAMGWLFDWLRWAGAANPKALLWFGPFIPQFVDPKGNYVGQIVLLGVTAMAVALVSDGAYAVLTGRAGALLSKKRIRLVSRLSGGFLIGGGIWLALTRGR
jgi:threonine/homoserine/homoserine lactone efflux protein